MSELDGTSFCSVNHMVLYCSFLDDCVFSIFRNKFHMDKSWMMENKYPQKYVLGVSMVMKFVHDNIGARTEVRCPCQYCLNIFSRCQGETEDHMSLKGIS
jgi:hypothetical protein